MVDKLRKTENLHVIFWLIKDMFWMMEFKTLGAIMILPTLAMAFYVTYLSKHHVDLITVNIAVAMWICANSAWMLSDFYGDLPRSVSLIFFITGILTMLFYVWRAHIKPYLFKTHD